MVDPPRLGCHIKHHRWHSHVYVYLNLSHGAVSIRQTKSTSFHPPEANRGRSEPNAAVAPPWSEDLGLP